MPRVVDALGREVLLAAPAKRVVSLVPSETESVVELAGVDRLVGRTLYCEEPRGVIERVPTCGGTKDVDVARVAELAPDLVLANKEENTRAAVEKLEALGLTVHVSFPCTARGSIDYLESLAVLLGIDRARAVAIDRVAAVVAAAERRIVERPVRVVVPIWVDPWMTIDGRTFASDVIELAGGHNVFADRPRRYPLAADLGRAPALLPDAVGERDTRYPRVTLEELAARAPELILLPDEPYRFGPAEAAQLGALPFQGARPPRIEFISGKDLFWYGTRVASAIERLSAVFAAMASPI